MGYDECSFFDMTTNEDTVRFLLQKDKKKASKIRFGNGQVRYAIYPNNFTYSILQTSLHIACTYNDVESVKQLLKLNADPNDVDNFKQNCLHIACQQGNIPIINLLLPRITNLTAKTQEGKFSQRHYQA